MLGSFHLSMIVVVSIVCIAAAVVMAMVVVVAQEQEIILVGGVKILWMSIYDYQIYEAMYCSCPI